MISKLVNLENLGNVKSMRDYREYCTEEQTLRALKLGAVLEPGVAYLSDIRPFVYREPDKKSCAWNNSSCWFCPTTQEMIRWIEDTTSIRVNIVSLNGDEFGIAVIDYTEEEPFDLTLNDNTEYSSRTEAERAVIDVVLKHLEDNKVMKKQIKIKVDYSYDFGDEDESRIEQDIKEGIAERLGIDTDDIDIEIE